MRLDVRQFEQADVIAVQGPLDLATMPRLRAVLHAQLAAGRTNLIIDLHRTTLMDAGTVGLLVRTAQRLEHAGGALRAIGARRVVLEVLQIVGEDKHFAAYDEPAELIAALGLVADDEACADAGPLARRWPGSRDVTTSVLLAGMAQVKPAAPERAELRRQVIEDNIAFATRLARRFRDRGEPIEDLNQVALLGLVNAVDGYDAERGCEFLSYATPTVVGEVRRYFRDKGWRIKVPRRLQELRLQVNRAKAELAQTQGASPTHAEIARHLDITEDEVAEAIEVSKLYNPSSLSTPTGSDSDSCVADWYGAEDPELEAVDNRLSVGPLLASLPERERKIVTMRFFGNLTQSQIAAELGISQMHVSRLLSQTLAALRTAVAAA
jgi:RNA polymerase sigma-B factor